ncbi:MAG TPA: SRPBCC family protein [Candidatus Limnocylindrales bacterium]
MRHLIRLGILGAIAAWLAERNLAMAARGRPPAPVRTFVVVDAPIDRVWAQVADIESQPRWMHDMKSVTIETPGPTGVGTHGWATVRILGVSTTDPVTVTEFEPPRRFGIRHEGRFSGAGLITLEPGADGSTTVVTWDETILPPILPRLGSLILRPILTGVFQADLDRLREIIER